MKIAVLADIHGNKDALHAVLTDMKHRGIQTIYNLGDSLYGPLFPLETYDLLKNSNIQSIKGNCDRILLEPSTSNLTVQYVQSLLEDEHRTWISNLPSALQTEDFYFCHGTPTSDEMYLLEEMSHNGAVLKKTEEIIGLVSGISQRLIVHIHISQESFIFRMVKSLLTQEVSGYLLMKMKCPSITKWNQAHLLPNIQLSQNKRMIGLLSKYTFLILDRKPLTKVKKMVDSIGLKH